MGDGNRIVDIIVFVCLFLAKVQHSFHTPNLFTYFVVSNRISKKQKKGVEKDEEPNKT